MNWRSLVVVGLVGVLGAGCSQIGPERIRNARFDYNQVIIQTWNEQMLLNLVRLKYRDTPYFLEVGNVSTQYSVDASVGASASINQNNPDSAGIAAGAGYSERPTITYTPLQGEQFVLRLLSPIPLDTLTLLSGSGWSVERVLRTCAVRINDVYNAPSASGPQPDYAPEFESFRRVSVLMRMLQKAKATELHIAETADGHELAVVHLKEPAELREEALEMKQILGLPPDQTQFVLSQAQYEDRPGDLLVGTRSLLSVMYYLSQAVEAPQRDIDAGRITVTLDHSGEPFDWSRITGGLFRVQSSSERPDNAYIAVQYRGSWFYIADDDLETKTTFALLAQLFNLLAGDVEMVAPVLTLPVGR